MHLFSPQFLADRAGVGGATEPTGLHRAFPNSAERLRLLVSWRLSLKSTSKVPPVGVRIRDAILVFNVLFLEGHLERN